MVFFTVGMGLKIMKNVEEINFLSLAAYVTFSISIVGA